MAKKLKVRKGDKVIVLTGKDKGRSGTILRVDPKEDRVLVEGVNMIKRHTRPTQTSPGGIIEREAPLHVSNVAHLDPKTNKATRIGYSTDKHGRKVRIARASGQAIDV